MDLVWNLFWEPCKTCVLYAHQFSPIGAMTNRDENGTEISHTESHRFPYLIRSNSYFRTNSNSVRNSEHQIRNRNENGFDILLTVFYISTFNSESEFEIRFKPNLAH